MSIRTIIISLFICIILSPVSAFAETLAQENTMSLTASVISVSYICIMSAAYIAAFTALILNLINKASALKEVALQVAIISVGAAIVLGFGATMSPWLTTGLVGQDMLAFGTFTAVVFATGGLATSWRTAKPAHKPVTKENKMPRNILILIAILIPMLPNTAFAANTQEPVMDSFDYLLTFTGCVTAAITLLITIINLLEARKDRKAAAAYAAAAPARAAEELAYRQGLDAIRLAAWWQKAENATAICGNAQVIIDFHISQSSIWGEACYSYVETADAIAKGTGLNRALWLKLK